MVAMRLGPPCKCHGWAMYWNRDQRYRAGGFWYCRAVHRRSTLASERKCVLDQLHQLPKEPGFD